MGLPAARDGTETLGQRVRRLRSTQGLTQGQLATRIKVSQPRISQIERDLDPGPLPPRTLRDIADALGVTPDTLITGDPRYDAVDLDEAAAGPPPSLSMTIPFVGRVAEIAAVVAALGREDVRLLSLIGPAGVGKTQLALHAAAALHDVLPDQAIVPLASCRDTASMLATIARTIGLRERDAQPLRQRLITALRERRMLLLLDNVEQALPAAAALVTDLLSACPRLTLLVTSRAPLAIRAEQISTVRPLPLPDAGATVTLATAGGSPAVQLFVVRTRSAVPGFTLSESNAAKVVSICRRLDGMPLAIELAAPRARVMTLDQLLQQLDRRLPLLTSGSRDLPSRQQSLRANIAWSVDLLTREQQTLFRRLAVFAESFTLEAAVAVMGDAMAGAAPSPPIPVWSSAAVANGIAQLLDQSLLTRTEQPDGTPRFGMLETIHEYADEQLEASGETREFRHRHLAWSLSLAEEAAPRLFTVDDDVWLQRLQDEDGNLRAALDWALGPGDGPDVELGLRLCGALSDYWFLTARLSEGRAWLIRAITRSADQTPSPGRARSLIGACQIEQTRAAIAPALMYGELGLAAAEALGDRPGVGRALLFLGNLAMMQQRFPEAQAWHEQALVCFQQVGDQSWVALALLNLGLDDYYLGDLDRAAVRAEEGLALARTTGNRWDTLNGLYVLGLVARARGDFAAANALFGERIHLSWQFGSQRDIADSLSGFGAVAVAAGDRERGARFLGAAEALYRRLEISVPPPLWPDWFALTDAARHDVSSADASPCWASSTIEQAVREALGSLPGSAPFLPPAVP